MAVLRTLADEATRENNRWVDLALRSDDVDILEFVAAYSAQCDAARKLQEACLMRWLGIIPVD